MNKLITTAVTVAVLALGLTACTDDDCEGAGRLGDVTTMSMAERPSGGTSGGSRSGSGGGGGSKSGSGTKTGGKVSSSTSGGGGGSTGGKSKNKGKIKIDDDLFEDC